MGSDPLAIREGAGIPGSQCHVYSDLIRLTGLLRFAIRRQVYGELLSRVRAIIAGGDERDYRVGGINQRLRASEARSRHSFRRR